MRVVYSYIDVFGLIGDEIFEELVLLYNVSLIEIRIFELFLFFFNNIDVSVFVVILEIVNMFLFEFFNCIIEELVVILDVWDLENFK